MKAIIMYTSKYGCTEKSAYLLKTQLGEETEVVNLMHAKEPSLDRYDTVILGGSIYFGKIQKEMTEYILKNQTELSDMRLGQFICAGAKREQAVQELKTSFPEELFNKAVAKEIFGDEIYAQKLSLMDKFVLRMIKGKDLTGSGLSKETIEKFALVMKN